MSIWDDPAALEKLRLGAAAGKSAQEIARDIGGQCTRNAVTGKASRLGIRLENASPRAVGARHAAAERKRMNRFGGSQG